MGAKKGVDQQCGFFHLAARAKGWKNHRRHGHRGRSPPGSGSEAENPDLFAGSSQRGAQRRAHALRPKRPDRIDLPAFRSGAGNNHPPPGKQKLPATRSLSRRQQPKGNAAAFPFFFSHWLFFAPAAASRKLFYLESRIHRTKLSQFHFHFFYAGIF